jgi:Domain of unknown function (DUF6268)
MHKSTHMRLCYKYLLGLILFFLSAIDAHAQLNFALHQLFRPNIRLRYQVLANSSLGNDSLQLGYQQASIAAIVPLGGNVSASLKELQLKAQQSFLNLQFGGRISQFPLMQAQTLANATIGFTHLRGQVGRGVWAYTAQIGGIANQTDAGRTNPFAIMGALKVRIKGLRKQNILGVGAGMNGGQFFIAPIIGWNRRLAKKWDIAILLPIQISISYKHNKRLLFEWNNNFSAFAFQRSPDIARYSDVRTSLEMTWKMHKAAQLMLEVGGAYYQNATIRNTDKRITLGSLKIHHLGFTPFVSLALRFQLAGGFMSAQMFESGL